MSLTYGERMLVRAEARARRRAARRRRAILLLPATVATLWSLANLIAARHARLSDMDAGFFRQGIDHLQPILWTVVLVLAPLAIAVKPDPIPMGAALALLAGPAVSPFLFGPGGWSVWQTGVVGLVCALILFAARERARRMPDS